ncbi:MAG TPA: mercuric transporter MerT family protein [Rhizomicrobium sp.]|nr:mercuric transporter MerT family protein [Rhizomicrobium sp.]
MTKIMPGTGAHTASASEEVNARDRSATGVELASIGAIMAAIAAASCCVVPFTLCTLGISGAWISNLTGLEPYRPIFALLAFGFLAYGFYHVYRKPQVACAEGTYCAMPSSARTTRIGLWTAVVLIVIALGFPKIAPFFL